MNLRTTLSTILVGGFTLLHLPNAKAKEASVAPPPIPREFRGLWITTIYNINWPSKPGLDTEQQKTELIAILDRAVQLKLNAVILQVRGSCDALYASPYEPWAQCLTGTMGKAPTPFYDPLAFAVAEAHKRGLEIHAWFNPFRARISDKVVLPPDHVAKESPQLVREHGKFLWMNPGSKAAQDYTIKVMLDVVKRYDIDGVQIDDYFYPSAEKDAQGKWVGFDDETSWNRYVGQGGTRNRDDWRRENINVFIDRLYSEIKTEKRWVKFGISPPGIWRPGYPAQIKGRDVYSAIYADSKKWLENGWCDYFSPQLYWKIDAREQSYPVLLKWWLVQNQKGRHIWPGLNTVKVTEDWPAQELINQIGITRGHYGSTGHIHYHTKALFQNPKGLADEVAKIYAQRALIPPSPWLNNTVPGKPSLDTKRDKNGVKLSWRPGILGKTWQWALQKRVDGKWTTEILPANRLVEQLNGSNLPDVVALTAVSRTGITSATVVEQVR